MADFFRRKKFILCGLVCNHHLSELANVYGTIRVATLNAENLPVDSRCSIHGCKEHIGYMVERYYEAKEPDQ